MRPQLKNLSTLTLTLLIAFQALSQSSGELPTTLLKTWYAVKVGNPEGGEMSPTSSKEILTFNSDGTLNIKDRDLSIDAKWEYIHDSKTINATINLDGNERVVELAVRNLTDSTLLLVSPQKATAYSILPPDPNAPKPRKAPLVVNSVSTIDVDSWSGLHPFNYKITESKNGEIESHEAIGVFILLHIEGKNILRWNEDGLTTDIEVAKGPEIEDEMLFDLVTEDPEFAGQVVFREDNSIYFNLKKNMSKVEYIKQ